MRRPKQESDLNLNCPECGKATKILDTINMGVVVWRSRACMDLKCNKIFGSKEIREDLETLAAHIVATIVAFELTVNNKRCDPETTKLWVNVIKRVLKDYQDE